MPALAALIQEGPGSRRPLDALYRIGSPDALAVLYEATQTRRDPWPAYELIGDLEHPDRLGQLALAAQHESDSHRAYASAALALALGRH